MQTILNTGEDLWFRLRTLSPIHQTSETDANDKPKLRTMKTFFDDSNEAGEIPILSGNSFRGRMRRSIAYHMWKRLGIDVKETYAKGTGALKETFHTMTSGGTLAPGVKRLDRDGVAAVAELLPIFTLLGGSYAGSPHDGKIAVMNAKPASMDLRSTFPSSLPQEWLEDRDSRTVYTNARQQRGTGGEFTTWRHPDVAVVDLPGSAGDGEKVASAYRSMPVSFDYILPGTTMVWQVVVGNDVTPLEWSMLGFAIQQVVAFPFLGGKLQAGCGQVEWLNHPSDDRLSSQLFEDYLGESQNELYALLTHPKGLFHAVESVKE